MANPTFDSVFKQRKMILIGFFAIILLGFVLLGFKEFRDATQLFVTATQPKNKEKKHSVLVPVIITYNHDLDESTTKNIAVSPNIEGIASIVDGKKLQFVPKDQWQANTTYTFTVNEAKSKDGKTSPKTTITFATQDVPYEDIPLQQQQQLIKGSDSWENEFPFTDSLPVTTSDYRITYMNGTDAQGKMTVTIELYGIYNRPSQKPQYVADLKAHKEAALKYLDDHGADFSKINIIFDPDPDTVQ